MDPNPLETLQSGGTSPGLQSRDSLASPLATRDSDDAPERVLVAHSESMLSIHAELQKRTKSMQVREPQPTTVQESYACEEDTQNFHLIERPSMNDVNEILSLLKVKTSMLALGACERVKKLARAHPVDVIRSPILQELLNILIEGPTTPLAGGVISALVTLALVPEGRKHIVLLGGATPIVKFLSRCDINHGNTSKALQLMMNLAADSANRRILREARAVEVVVQLMNKCPLGPLMAHAMGALHNIMLTDSKAKQRALDAGVVNVLARVLASEQEEGAVLGVRAHMLLSDLLRVEDMQVRLIAAAQAQGLYIPGLMPAPKGKSMKPAARRTDMSMDGGGGEDLEDPEASELASARSSIATPTQGDAQPEEGGQQQQNEEKQGKGGEEGERAQGG